MGGYPKRLDKDGRSHFAKRIAGLRAESAGQWGSLTCAGMLAHLEVAFRGTIQDGAVQTRARGNWLTRNVMKPLLLHLLPMPKGVKMPKALTPEPNASFDELREQVLALLDEFIAAVERDPRRKVAHPLFGPMTMREWSYLHAKHLDHHLRQFGA
ncbi:MAG: DUF1569 domain-containing protein [Candidatus Sumerlaeia bacterium]|nr:DUF1569 domain-containing protein [Candidatus Sumerlaeia bacterium]